MHLFTDTAQGNVDSKVSEKFASDTDEHNEQHTRAGTEQQQMASVR